MPDLAMEFRDGFWTAKGDAATTVLNPAHQAIIDTLRTTGYPMTPTQLATVLDVNLNTMKVHLMRLVERGLVGKDGQGRYAHRIRTPEETSRVTPCNPVTPLAEAEERSTPSPVPLEPDHRGDTADSVTHVLEGESPPDERMVTRVTAVTPVTPAAPPATNGQGQPSTNGDTTRHHNHSMPVEGPPQFCPGCSDRTCWLDRETYYQCAKRSCGRKVLKSTGTNGRFAHE
jgi:hypothetical protein